MKTFIFTILIAITSISYSQTEILTAEQKNELINYDYSSFVNGQKTVNQFLSEVPYVNFSTNENYDFSRGDTVLLNGFEISFNSNDYDFIITLRVENFEHILNERYDPNNPWDIELLKQEKIKFVIIQDLSSDNYAGYILHVE